MNPGAATPGLHRELSLVYLAVDQLNVSCAHRLWKGRQATSSAEVVLQSFNKLGPDVREWLPASEVRSLFCACGVAPPVDDGTLGSLLECIAYPARASFATGPMAPRGEWTLKGGRHVPPLPGEEEMFEHLYVRGTGGVYSFTTVDYESNLAASGPPELVAKERPLRLFDEFLDPLAATRMYLARVHKVPELEVGHYIQRWIVATFGL
ncbi:MAG TPA: hypothetical protein VGO40_20600, partial [Longimicrobium sp.]|nr:hypothetical protein [Longimicrobium sp.]